MSDTRETVVFIAVIVTLAGLLALLFIDPFENQYNDESEENAPEDTYDVRYNFDVEIVDKINVNDEWDGFQSPARGNFALMAITIENASSEDIYIDKHDFEIYEGIAPPMKIEIRDNYLFTTYPGTINSGERGEVILAAYIPHGEDTNVFPVFKYLDAKIDYLPVPSIPAFSNVYKPKPNITYAVAHEFTEQLITDNGYVEPRYGKGFKIYTVTVDCVEMIWFSTSMLHLYQGDIRTDYKYHDVPLILPKGQSIFHVAFEVQSEYTGLEIDYPLSASGDLTLHPVLSS